VFDLGAHLAETAIASTLTLRQFTARLGLFLHGSEHARVFRRALLLVARVTLVAVDGAVVLAN